MYIHGATRRGETEKDIEMYRVPTTHTMKSARARARCPLCGPCLSSHARVCTSRLARSDVRDVTARRCYIASFAIVTRATIKSGLHGRKTQRTGVDELRCDRLETRTWRGNGSRYAGNFLRRPINTNRISWCKRCRAKTNVNVMDNANDARRPHAVARNQNNLRLISLGNRLTTLRRATTGAATR